jgi:N-acetylglucosamine-6-phosphate deacetylase
MGYIRARAAEGTIIGIGHTAAGAPLIAEAVDAGARLSTHLGNGSHAMVERLDNYVWAQMAEDRLWASLIFDGYHLPPPVMKVMLRAKGVGRALLVSDAVALAGLPPGVYDSQVGKIELHEDGRLSVYGTPYLAGSVSNLTTGVANAVVEGGLSLADAVKLASANPAQLLGLDGPGGRGSVRVGATADLTVFGFDPPGKSIVVEQTIVRGEVVYER